MGYIVMSAPLRKEAPEWFAPLSYGKDGEIAPDQLLRRGGRATMFETPAAANTAIRDTLAKARADGDKWPDKYGIYLLTVEDAPSNFASERPAACGRSARLESYAAGDTE